MNKLPDLLIKMFVKIKPKNEKSDVMQITKFYQLIRRNNFIQIKIEQPDTQSDLVETIFQNVSL